MGAVIRAVEPRDAEALARMRAALWPDTPLDDHASEVRALLDGRPLTTLPLTTLVAADERGELVGFVEVDLRSHADGCDPQRPVGYVEGWYVRPENRRQGVGRALVAAAEEWARSLGAREMASDTWADNEGSVRAHVALGFEAGDTCVHFRKTLAPASVAAPRAERRNDAILASLLALDVVLASWGFFAPELWFRVFHGAAYVDPQGLLPRMAANWAAFALFQAVALARWRRAPWWLAVAAGLRLSDIFTDATYLVACEHATWFGRVALAGAGPLNVLAGWQLLRAFKEANRPREGARPAP